MSKNFPDVFGAQAQQDGDLTAEENIHKLMVSQARLEARLATYNRRSPSAGQTAALDNQLQRLVDQDRTGLARNLDEASKDGRSKSITNGYDTGWLTQDAEGLNPEQVRQRVLTIEKMRSTVDSAMKDLPLVSQRANAQEVSIGFIRSNETKSYALNQTELDKQAKALAEDPKGQALLENYREAVRSSAEKGMMQRQASVARFTANRVLTGGPSGVSNQERATADATLARISNLRLGDTSTTVVNTTKLTEPGVAGNRILATQAVVARALTMDPQVTQLRQRTALLSQEENHKLGRDEAYVSAVVAIDEQAGLAAETGNKELAARTTERAVSSPALELAGRSLPAPG